MDLSGERKVKDTTLIHKKFEGRLEKLDCTCFGRICMDQMSSLQLTEGAFPRPYRCWLAFCSLPAVCLFSRCVSNMVTSCPVVVWVIKANSVFGWMPAPAKHQKITLAGVEELPFDTVWSPALFTFSPPSLFPRMSPTSPPVCRLLLVIQSTCESPRNIKLSQVCRKLMLRKKADNPTAQGLPALFLACQFSSEPCFWLTRWHTSTLEQALACGISCRSGN